MQDGPLARYRSMVRSGELVPDIAQELAAEKLQLLADRLGRLKPRRLGDFLNPFARMRRTVPEGLYLHGGVGRGKTLLLDLFFEAVHFAPKRRLHFQEFMAEAHEAIAHARQSAADPIGSAAAKIAASAALLGFDELDVTDIADAMILGRLFQHLFEREVVIVATSNTGPRDLYPDGLNRELFQPFIGLIEQRMDINEVEAAKDYRLEKLRDNALYLTPADARAGAAMDASWRRLTGKEHGEPQTLHLKGRSILVPEAALGVARFSFADLCEAPLGSLDYQRIAHSFHTLIVEGIPVLGPEKRNQARRLMTLIDALYDNGVGLIASAEAEPHALYGEGDGARSFARTASRLMEMRSEAYLRAGRRHRNPRRGSG
jgi:cell division protein ZapE